MYTGSVLPHQTQILNILWIHLQVRNWNWKPMIKIMLWKKESLFWITDKKTDPCQLQKGIKRLKYNKNDYFFVSLFVCKPFFMMNFQYSDPVFSFVSVHLCWFSFLWLMIFQGFQPLRASLKCIKLVLD